ncbi:MAG: Segregation and condensation protein A [Phycisphaerales bacterium]|nr:Segregation and condensation protein A [Phycisphaerales bacterium]
MLTDDYRVRLDRFEGPLDLLLFLIRRDEVDITNIPVARITEQYLEFLGQIDRIDIDVAGEFLVMAATLMEIKSRMLGPAPKALEASVQQPGGPSEDPRAELVRQLLEYKRFRDAAGALEQRLAEWSNRFPAGSAAVESAPVEETDDDEPVDLGDVQIFDLISAFQKIMEAVNFERLGAHEVHYDDTPIELHAEDIVDRLRREEADIGTPEVELGMLFSGRTRAEMIGLFLAVLDLVRHCRLEVRQDKIGGTVMLKLAATGPVVNVVARPEAPSPAGAEAAAAGPAGSVAVDRAAGPQGQEPS